MSGPNAKTEGGNILLCDFGMADYIVSDHRDTPEPHSGGPNQNIGPSDTSTCIAGSLQYAAPELFNTTGSIFSTAADIWAFGVVVYAIITGELPFNAGLDSKTTRKILEGDWDIGLLRKGQAARESPDDVVDLVRGCLAMDPARRWTITEILKCRWLEGCQELYEHIERPWIS
jgi:serine/threonine protein kinase